jgi:ABC-type sugar transport system ATPase subunit
VWLLDEPLASLDAPLRRQLGREIVALQKSSGTTALFVTHDQSEALAYADWLMVMDHGRVEQVGTPAEVYARPANCFVASFLGDPPMNLLKGEVRQGRFRAEGVSLDLPAKATEGAVVVGIRPEEILLADGDESMTVRGVLQSIEYRGHAIVAEVLVGNQALSVRCTTHARWTVGASLPLMLPPEKLHVFKSYAK